jgi:hypothetical protein
MYSTPVFSYIQQETALGSLTSHNPIGLHGLLTGIALLYGDGVYFLVGTIWTVSPATSIQYLAVN